MSAPASTSTSVAPTAAATATVAVPSARTILGIIALALVLRAACFPFAENKHGDAPMRALIAEWMNLDPPAAADPRTYCQFGPLHTTLMRPFLWLDPVAARSSRYLSLLAGIAVFFPFLRLARRMLGASKAVGASHAPALAALALAVSPLHIQASTTASSEALYLLLMVTCLERLLAALDSGRRAAFAVAGLLASLAAVTRYDAWIDFPAVALAAWVFARPGVSGRESVTGSVRSSRRSSPRSSRLPGLLIFAVATASLPVAWIAWSARATADPFFFAHYITSDHAHLAAAVNARWGPLLARGRQVGIWSLSFVAAMSLPMVVGAATALRRFASLPPAAKIVVVAALVPPALYLAKGVLLLSFEPLPRFGLVPGALLLPLAAAALLHEARGDAPDGALGGRGRSRSGHARRDAIALAVAGSAVALSAIVLVAAWSGPGRIWSGAESLAPVTRLDAEDRQLAAYLRAHRRGDERVFIQPLDFADIVIAHAAGVPAPLTVSLAITRTAGATVAATLARTGARWLAAYDGGADNRGWTAAPDWPAESIRFGHWRLLHSPSPAPAPP